MEWLADDMLVVSELDGTISQVSLPSGSRKNLLRLPDVAKELQSGLMGLALHPDFQQDSLIFAAYTSYKGDSLVLRILELRYHTRPDTLLPVRIVVDDLPAAPTDIGGRLLALPDRTLLLSIGDNELSERAQDPKSLNGKILRFRLDGRIPDDNPYPDSPVLAAGIRNCHGITLVTPADPSASFADLSILFTDHGTMSDDELNRLVPGGNFGWPRVSGHCDNEPPIVCTRPDLLAPLMAWTPTIAPAALAFYRHDRYADLRQHLLVANLYDQSLKAIRLDDSNLPAGEAFDLLSGTIGRIRDVLVSPDGRIFVCSSNADLYGASPAGSDGIYELRPDHTTPSPSAALLSTPAEDTLRLDSSLLEIRILVRGLVHPWDMTWGVDDKIWFTENGGYIKRLHTATGQLDTILRLPDCHHSWGNPGIYSLAFHPEYPEQPYLYVHYTDSPTRSKLVRFRYDPVTDSLLDPIPVLPDITANESHNGSRLVFTPDRKILFAMGEAYTPELAQDLSSLNGKILRLNPDGTVPEDNPFPNSLIYSYGHRNPQGLALLPNGILWSSEHGPNNDDELNIIRKGGNYGWPRVQGFCDLRSEQRYCRDMQVIEPIIAWTPTVAPCALEYYDHPAIPEWRHALFQVFLKKGNGKTGQRLAVMHLGETGDTILRTTEYFTNTFGRLRDVLFSPDGRVFFCTSNREVSGNGRKALRPDDDKIIELRPIPCR